MQLYERSPAPQSFRRPALNAASIQRARNFGADPAQQWRRDRDDPWIPRARSHFGDYRKPGWRPSSRRDALARRVLQASIGVLVAVAAGCFWLLYGTFGFSTAVPPASVAIQTPSAKSDGGGLVVSSGKSDLLLAPASRRDATGAIDWSARAPARAANPAIDNADSPAAVVARVWSIFEPKPDQAKDQGRDRVMETKSKPLARVAALEIPAPQATTRSRAASEPVLPRIPPEGEPKTTLVDFETAPFPYDGKVLRSSRPFLDAGQPGHRGHTNFRGRVLWESDTFNDPRVLLHIPPGFDPNRPGVMIVFFHGHGANLARDVRDRQQVPAQITASGVNAVLVAPQFAVNAADSSAGKFWEPGGFKRFVDEAAKQLSQLHGDPRTTQAFANMPIVIVAYSGGFGPTLSVLDRGGVAPSRLRGLVLLDALYSGTEKFASWIASNRSAFFVSSYTPHTRRLNAELEQMLSEKSVSYSSELRRNHLPGSVTFLPTGDISHRDFVNRAWADSPLKDLLVRLDEYDTRAPVATAARTSPFAPKD